MKEYKENIKNRDDFESYEYFKFMKKEYENSLETFEQRLKYAEDDYAFELNFIIIVTDKNEEKLIQCKQNLDYLREIVKTIKKKIKAWEKELDKLSNFKIQE